MIRKLDKDDAEQVFELMDQVYSDHSFLRHGIDRYEQNLQDGSYVSIGEFDGSKLRAHAGYKVLANHAIINALVVSPEHRTMNLGRDVFNARLDDIVQNRSFDFVVGFSMMQHTYSQSLYDDWFRPMGIDIGYQDIYHKSDANLNRGTRSNAELVLCRRLSDRAMQVGIHVPKRDRSMANNILGKLGVGTQFNDGGELDSNTGTFLGFHPDGEGELFLPAFLPTGIAVDFSPLVTSNNERQDFVDEIRNRYEQTIKS